MMINADHKEFGDIANSSFVCL